MSDWDKMAKTAVMQGVDPSTFISSRESKEDPVPDERKEDEVPTRLNKSDTFDMEGTEEQVVIEQYYQS